MTQPHHQIISTWRNNKRHINSIDLFMLLMSMRWDCVSELLPIVHSQVIYEYGEPRWNDIDRGKHMILTPELSYNPTSRVIWQQIEGAAKRMANLDLRRIFAHTRNSFFTCCKILRYRASGSTSTPKEVELRIFIALASSSPQPGLNPRTLALMASTITITPPRRLNYK
jgi:hypothetical protein